MDKDKIRSYLNSLGLTKETMSDTPFNNLVNSLSGESNRQHFIDKINENAKFMKWNKISMNDFMSKGKSIYYSLND